MKNFNIKVLLVDDEKMFTELTKEYLEEKSMAVTLKHSAIEGLDAFKSVDFDICILDIKMPGKDGFTLAEEIRAINSAMPIIFLTAQTEKSEKIKGLSLGADDYMTKPFSMEELALRIQNILRRYNQSSKSVKTEFQIGKFNFNPQARTLSQENENYKLSSIESKLLKLLCEKQPNHLQREEAMQKIWGDDDIYKGRSLNVYMTKLRKYFKSDSSVEILNLHGEGYQLIAD